MAQKQDELTRLRELLAEVWEQGRLAGLAGATEEANPYRRPE